VLLVAAWGSFPPQDYRTDLKKAGVTLAHNTDTMMGKITMNGQDIRAKYEKELQLVANKFNTMNLVTEAVGHNVDQLAKKTVPFLSGSNSGELMNIDMAKDELNEVKSNERELYGKAQEILTDGSAAMSSAISSGVSSTAIDSTQSTREAMAEADKMSKDFESGSQKLKDEGRRENRHVSKEYAEMKEEVNKDFKEQKDWARLLNNKGSKVGAETSSALQYIKEMTAKTAAAIKDEGVDSKELLGEVRGDLLRGYSKSQGDMSTLSADQEKEEMAKWNTLDASLVHQRDEISKLQNKGLDQMDKAYEKGFANVDDVDTDALETMKASKAETVEVATELKEMIESAKGDEKKYRDTRDNIGNTIYKTTKELEDSQRGVEKVTFGTAEQEMKDIAIAAQQSSTAKLNDSVERESTNVQGLLTSAGALKKEFDQIENKANAQLGDREFQEKYYSKGLKDLDERLQKVSGLSRHRNDLNVKMWRQVKSDISTDLSTLTEQLTENEKPMEEATQELQDYGEEKGTQLKEMGEAALTSLDNREKNAEAATKAATEVVAEAKEELEKQMGPTMTKLSTAHIDASSLAVTSIPVLESDVGRWSRKVDELGTILHNNINDEAQDIVHESTAVTGEENGRIAQKMTELTNSLATAMHKEDNAVLDQVSRTRAAGKDAEERILAKATNIVHDTKLVETEAHENSEEVAQLNDKIRSTIKKNSVANQLRLGGEFGQTEDAFARSLVPVSTSARAKIAKARQDATAKMDSATASLRNTVAQRAETIATEIEAKTTQDRSDIRDVVEELRPRIAAANQRVVELTADMRGVSRNEGEWSEKLRKMVSGEASKASHAAMLTAESAVRTQAAVDDKFQKMRKVMAEEVHGLDYRKKEAIDKLTAKAKELTHRVLADTELTKKEAEEKLIAIDSWMEENIKTTMDPLKGAENTVENVQHETEKFAADTKKRLDSLDVLLVSGSYNSLTPAEADEAKKGLEMDRVIEGATSAADRVVKKALQDTKAATIQHEADAEDARQQMLADSEIENQAATTAVADLERTTDDLASDVYDHEINYEAAVAKLTKSGTHLQELQGNDAKKNPLLLLAKERTDKLEEEGNQFNNLRHGVTQQLEGWVSTLVNFFHGKDGFAKEQEEKHTAFEHKFAAMMENEHMQLLKSVHTANVEAQALIKDDDSRWEELKNWEGADEKWKADVKQAFSDLGNSVDDEVNGLKTEEENFQTDATKGANSVQSKEEAKIAGVLNAAETAIGDAAIAQADSEDRMKQQQLDKAESAKAAIADAAETMANGMKNAKEASDGAAVQAATFDAGFKKSKAQQDVLNDSEATLLKNGKEKAEKAQADVLKKMKGLTSLLEVSEDVSEDVLEARALGEHAALASKHASLKKRLEELRKSHQPL